MRKFKIVLKTINKGDCMKKEILILSMAAICGMSSLVANECANCETPVATVPAEEKKADQTNETVATAEAPAAETTASE